MKAYFTEMFAFERWANEQILTWMESHSPHPEMTRIFAHTIADSLPWQHLLRGEEVPASFNPEPDWSLAECRVRFEETAGALQAIVREADLDAIVRSPGPGGVVFENTAAEILTGLLNHAEHHRGQVLLLIAHETGEYVPSLYFSYVRKVPAALRG